MAGRFFSLLVTRGRHCGAYRAIR